MKVRFLTTLLALPFIYLAAEPKRGLEAITVAEGLIVELAAGPDLAPYGMLADFDERGRLFIAASSGKNIGGKAMSEKPECKILMLEAHGALVFLVGWSVWFSRSPLNETLRNAASADRASDPGVPVTYRTAWLGLGVSVVFLGGWCVAAGMEVWATVLQLILMFIELFGVAKYAAVTGFTFLSPGGAREEQSGCSSVARPTCRQVRSPRSGS